MFKSLDSTASVVGIFMYLTISKFKQVLRSRERSRKGLDYNTVTYHIHILCDVDLSCLEPRLKVLVISLWDLQEVLASSFQVAHGHDDVVCIHCDVLDACRPIVVNVFLFKEKFKDQIIWLLFGEKITTSNNYTARCVPNSREKQIYCPKKL